MTLHDVSVPVAPELGAVSLVYRYTVVGASKASIDTGVDTPNAGSNDWTNGDLLEVLMAVQTQDAGVQGNTLNLTVNNDTGSNYDLQEVYGNNLTAGAVANLAQTKWLLGGHGVGGLSNYPAFWTLQVPNYLGTTFYKLGSLALGYVDTSAANCIIGPCVAGYRSTSAISRLKIAGASANLSIGSQLLVYKRIAA